MNNKKTVKNLIGICTKFTNKDIDMEEFKKELDNFFVKNSLSIREKIYSVMYVLFNCEYSDDLLERFVSLEMNKFWYIALTYCGIDASKEEDLCVEENYDLIRPLVFNAIMSVCKNDYDDTMRVFDSMISYINALENQNMFQDLINTDFSKLIDADRVLIEDLQKNESMIKDLADITRATNSTLSTVNSIIEKQVVNEINNK